MYAVCVGGDQTPGDIDVDAWSDEDVGPAPRRGSVWDGGATGELREAFANPFSGGRRVVAAPRAAGSPPPATAERVPDGNAACGKQLASHGLFYVLVTVLLFPSTSFAQHVCMPCLVTPTVHATWRRP